MCFFGCQHIFSRMHMWKFIQLDEETSTKVLTGEPVPTWAPWHSLAAGHISLPEALQKTKPWRAYRQPNPFHELLIDWLVLWKSLYKWDISSHRDPYFTIANPVSEAQLYRDPEISWLAIIPLKLGSLSSPQILKRVKARYRRIYL